VRGGAWGSKSNIGCCTFYVIDFDLQIKHSKLESTLENEEKPARPPWEKLRNRSGQKGGASKARFPDDEPHIRQRYVMMESPAWKALSLNARRVLDRIEIEFGKHRGKPETNGELIVTYDDFVKYGICRRLVRPAINEVVALGFVRITRAGVAGNAHGSVRAT
jgi:hypothetical protein